MGVGNSKAYQFFYSVQTNFLLPMRGDSFLKIRIFTKNQRLSDAKNHFLVVRNHIFWFFFLPQNNIFTQESRVFKNSSCEKGSYFDS